MKVELELSTGASARIVKNLWPLYQHELSEFSGSSPNAHGVFNDDEAIRDLADHVDGLTPWWEDPGALFPYLIRADGKPAGFNLIAAQSRLPKGLDVDFVVHEFFVLHPYRGHGVAGRAAKEGFQRHRGRWEVVTFPTHTRAISFWRRTIHEYAGDLREGEIDHPWGRKRAFWFENFEGASKASS